MKQNNKNIIIIVSEFYPELSELLLNDCSNYLIDNDIKEKSIFVYKVSGVFEIPGTVNYVSKYHSPDAIITLGVVIKGKTPHFDFISSACANSISKLTIKKKFPIIFGVLCTESLEQALLRAEKKGKEMIDTAIKTFYEYEKVKSN